jgi:hypothetical protein
MAINLEMINIIIPISKVIVCVGLSKFNAMSEFGLSHDDYLYRIGAMNTFDVEQIIQYWKQKGLKLTGKRKGSEYWRDICVVDTFEGPTLPCDWLEFDPEANKVRYKLKDGKIRP